MKSKIEVEILVRSRRWNRHSDAQTIVNTAILTAARSVSTGPASLAIVLTHDSEVRKLNSRWRGKDAPTNVLSFPAAASPASPGETKTKAPYIGDIAIAYETVAREAKAEGKEFGHHLAHLAVHGFLHLLGYEHDDARDAREMENLETRILRVLTIPDPYANDH